MSPSAWNKSTVALYLSYFKSEKTSMPGSFARPFKKTQLHRKRRAHHFSTKLPYQLNRGRSRPTRRQQVIANQYVLARLHRVLVNVELVRTIFQLIGHRRALGRQFLRLTYRNESRAQAGTPAPDQK